MNKRYLTSEQAISLLPEGDYIHTLYGGFALIGADWERQEVINKLKSVDKIEIAGDVARNIGHGLAVYNDDAQYFSDILFVETDKKKLDAFDPIEEDTTDGDCCAKCRYFHRLKHNFKVDEGFEESYCCDVLLHLPEDESEGWVDEVEPQDICEMFCSDRRT